MPTSQDNANFIWQVADDILRGSFRPHEYGDTILPFVVLRRLDCVLEKNKDKVLEAHTKYKDKLPDLRQVLLKASEVNFYNTSKFDLQRLKQDAQHIELNFRNYVNGYSKNVYDILENFQIDKVVEKLVKNKSLFLVVDKFTEIDLHPDKVSNHEMGYIFEELIRRFNEQANETAGDHFTPREVIKLMVNVLFAEHQDELKGKGIIRNLFDPACGTGGMLTIAKEHIHEKINPKAEIITYGQEINPQSFAIAKADTLIVNEKDEADNIRFGNSLTEDRFISNKFDFMLSNPPFGVSWKKEQEFVENESANPNGRFFAGTPRVSDGALLFLQHMISKMEKKGSRIAIIHNGSPLFTGDAGSGESNIRKWIIENDMLEAVIGLPNQLFYNTGISTYIWIVTNKKPEHRQGKVQMINAVDMYEKMRKSLGNKRNYITDEQIEKITSIYNGFRQGEYCKIFKNEDFGYTKVTVERPLLDKKGNAVKDNKGVIKPDADLRDTESIPLTENIQKYFEREVLPHVPDAWMDRTKDKVGYEISFTKYFYKYQPLRSLKEITSDILKLERETEGLLKEIIE
jgi:type I restriction enzyme M protein